MKLPAHPGDVVEHEITAPAELGVTDAARYPGVTRRAQSGPLNERVDLSPETVLRIEKACDVGMVTLLRMPTSFAIAKQRQNEGQINVSRWAGPAG